MEMEEEYHVPSYIMKNYNLLIKYENNKGCVVKLRKKQNEMKKKKVQKNCVYCSNTYERSRVVNKTMKNN